MIFKQVHIIRGCMVFKQEGNLCSVREMTPQIIYVIGSITHSFTHRKFWRKKSGVDCLLALKRSEVPRKGKGLGLMHRSTRPIEILPCVQKLYKTGHVAASQRVQCSCALDPSLSRENKAINEARIYFIIIYFFKSKLLY